MTHIGKNIHVSDKIKISTITLPPRSQSPRSQSPRSQSPGPQSPGPQSPGPQSPKKAISTGALIGIIIGITVLIMIIYIYYTKRYLDKN